MAVKKYWKILIIISIIVLIFLFPRFLILKYQDFIYSDINEVPHYKVAIVFGAGIKDDGTPSDMLKDRLITAAELYKAGKTDKILVSGDNRFENYNEPEAMYRYLTEVGGIPVDDVVKDFAGRRTYDTCARAKNIWGIDKALLISQEYHLIRAIFTCEAFGIESWGFSATKQPYIFDKYFQLREFAAQYKAFIDVYIWEPNYMKGEKEKL